MCFRFFKFIFLSVDHTYSNLEALRIPLNSQTIQQRQQGAYKLLTKTELNAVRVLIKESEEKGSLIRITPQLLAELDEIKDQTISTERFRDLAGVILQKLIEKLDSFSIAPDKTIVVLPWRSSLAFGLAFIDKGYKNFWHIGIYRDEETLMLHIYYKNDWDFPDNADYKNIKVVIADSMLATNGTIINIIELLKEKRIPLENIIVCNIVSAPEGLCLPQEGILEKYPQIRILTAALGDHINEKGRIVYENGVECIGDFGDRYIANNDWNEFSIIWEKAGLFTAQDSQAFANRMKQLQPASNRLVNLESLLTDNREKINSSL